MSRIVVFLLLLPSLAWPVPNVTGVSPSTITNGASVTIVGTGFGSKPQATPVLFDRVDNISLYNGLSDGQKIPTGLSNGYPWGDNSITPVTFRGPDYVQTFISNEGKSGSEGYKVLNKEAATLDNWEQRWTKTGQVYVSWWWKPATNFIGPAHSTKFIRLSDSASIDVITLSWTQEQLQFRGCQFWRSWSGNINQWNFMELWLDEVNYIVSARINNSDWYTGSFNRAVNPSNCSGQDPSWLSERFNTVWKIGWDGGGSAPPPLTSWMDDIYIDNTLARVMLCDTSTYSARSACEMQSPTNWSGSGTSITINGYVGEYSQGSTKYIYVADPSGAVNSTGYAVTIGVGGGDTTPPVISNPLPSGTQAIGTTNVTLQVTTDENATCRYGSSDAAYTSLPSTFSTTGGITHQQSLAVSAGSYTRYVRCQDGSGNANTSSTIITFTIPVLAPPTNFNVTVQ